jgi:hypothetical protein
MSGPNRPGDVPPDLPPEYAEAYRRGYRRAYDQGAPEQEAEREVEHTARLESLDSAFRPVPPDDVQSRPVHRRRESDQRRKLLAPLVLVGLVLVLVLSAYGLGRLFSSQVNDTDTSAPEPDGVVLSEDGTPADQPQKSKASKQKAYDGRVEAAAVGGASASCQSDSGVDAAGNAIGYDPSNVYDGDISTAWRCDGSGVGQRVTIDLPGTITIGQVGMVPGYAKTDPSSGADRYAENNRITRARWLFSDGTSVVQKLNGASGNRELQTMQIPKTEANQVVIEILKTTRGPRNTTAISEVKVGEVAG